MVLIGEPLFVSSFANVNSKLERWRSVFMVSAKVSEKPKLTVFTWLESFFARITAARKSSLLLIVWCVTGIIHTEARKRRMKPIMLIFLNTSAVLNLLECKKNW